MTKKSTQLLTKQSLQLLAIGFLIFVAFADFGTACDDVKKNKLASNNAKTKPHDDAAADDDFDSIDDTANSGWRAGSGSKEDPGVEKKKEDHPHKKKRGVGTHP